MLREAFGLLVRSRRRRQCGAHGSAAVLDLVLHLLLLEYHIQVVFCHPGRFLLGWAEAMDANRVWVRLTTYRQIIASLPRLGSLIVLHAELIDSLDSLIPKHLFLLLNQILKLVQIVFRRRRVLVCGKRYELVARHSFFRNILLIVPASRIVSLKFLM